jgi:alpha-tubulin suppressor-like RCC1 family protein
MKKQFLYIIAIVISQTISVIYPANASAQKISAGVFHSLAICGDGSVMGWGNNMFGELGNGMNGAVEHHPVAASGLTGMTAIGGGANFTVALKNDGSVWTWGSNTYGELGNGSPAGFSNVPVQVSSIYDITSIARGIQNAVVLKNDGTVWDWGYNNYGQLGNGTSGSYSNVPVQVSGLAGVVAVAGGAYHSLALKNDGTVWTWGFNMYGQLGNGTNTNSNVPVQVTTLAGIVAVAGGHGHSLALKNDGTVWDWGYNNFGQLGNGNNTDSNIPIEVSGLSQVTTATTALPESTGVYAFPNPFENELTIFGTKASGTAIIFDSNGKEIMRWNTLIGESKVNTSTILPGFYFLNYHEADKSVNIKLLKF